MAGISTIRAPEEESLIDAEDPEALSLAQEDDSIHIRGSADGACTRARSWRLGLCAVGILCAVALLTRREAPKASMLKNGDVHGITQLQFMGAPTQPVGYTAPVPDSSNPMIKMCNQMAGGACSKMESMYDDAKAKFKSILPSFMGGTSGATTTVAPAYGAAAPYGGSTLAPVLTTVVNGKVYLAPTTSMAPHTTIVNGKVYLAPTSPAPQALGYYVAPVPAGPKSKTDVSTSEPPHTATVAPALDVNQTAQVTASVSTVKVDHNVSPQALNRQVATNPVGVQPCVNGTHTGDGTPCTALKTYDYGPQYSGYKPGASPAPAPAR